MASVMKVHMNQLYYEFLNVNNIIPIDIHQCLRRSTSGYDYSFSARVTALCDKLSSGKPRADANPWYEDTIPQCIAIGGGVCVLYS